MTAEKIIVTNARGESFADVLRRLGTAGGVTYPPGATDEQIFELFSSNDTLTAATAAYALQAQTSAAVAAAFVNGLLFPNAAAGLAATTSGAYFAVGANGNITIYRNNAGVAEFVTSLFRNDFASPEQYGVPGAGANDNALFTAAVASGKPVIANGPLYEINQLSFTTAPFIIFGEHTEVRNVQASGAKKAAITVTGGYSGSAVDVVKFKLLDGTEVTELQNGQLTREVEVTDASAINVGDEVRIYEDGPAIESTRKGTPNPEPEDRNYRQFVTVLSKAGNVLTFHEYLSWPFTVALSMKVRKVNFVERAVIRGGKWTGGNPAGGGVKFQFCRHSVAAINFGSGLGQDESLNFGGAPVIFEDCWESYRGDIFVQWCTFVHHSERNQSCTFGKVLSGKKTTNGGIVIGGDIECSYDLITQDAPGDDNGDQITLANGTRRNTFAGFTGHGSNCYTAWVRQGCDDNSFGIFNSFNGETIGIQDFADGSAWDSVKIIGHPSGGALFAGNRTRAVVDIQVAATAVQFGSTYGDDADGPQKGLRITGRAVCTTPGDPLFKDLIIGPGLRESVVDLIGGTEGHTYAAGAIEHFTNDITLSGPNPYMLRGRNFDAGEQHRFLLTGIPSNPASGSGVTVKVPGIALDGGGDPIETADGLINLAPSASEDGTVYEIKLTRNQGYAGAWSEYRVLSRLDGTPDFVIMKEVVGTPTSPANADFIPKLRIVAGSPKRLEVFVGTDSPVAQAIMEVRRV